MADFQNTSSNAELTVNGYGVRQGGNSDVTPWKYLHHCANATSTSICNPTYACGRFHVRTPLPADTSSMGWNPIVLHVVGYHSYSGERFSDWKALLNVDGSNNNWYGSQIFSNRGNSSYPSDPYVYRSNGTYGGKQRVCFAVNKLGCCCNGWIWVRWFHRSSFFNDHPWAQVGMADNTHAW